MMGTVGRSEGRGGAAGEAATTAGARGDGDGSVVRPTIAPETYTIDELASTSGVASRTIRYYQAEGLLPWPTKQGRIALYGSDHLERLHFIATLQARGLQLSAIADLLSLDGPLRVSVREWLGLQADALAHWIEEPLMASRDELVTRLGGREELIEDLQASLLVEPVAAGDKYLIPRPRLLEITLEMEASGVQIRTSARMAHIITQHLAAAVEELAVLARERIGNGFGSFDRSQLRLTLDVVDRLAVEVVGLLFAEQLSSAVEAFQRAALVLVDDAGGAERSTTA